MKLFGNSSKRKTDKGINKSENPEIKGTSARPVSDTGSKEKRTPEEQKKIDELIANYQKKKVRRRIIILGVLIIIILAFMIAIKLTIVPPELAPTKPTDVLPSGDSTSSPMPSIIDSERKEDFYTFVVVGKDDGNGNTDTMLVGAFDAKNKKLNMLSIPRDTMVNVPWSVKKVNTLMAFNEDSIEGLKSGLRDILGFTVDSYIVVDLDAFVALVDTIGGVYFDIPVNMNYEDPKQDLYIHFQKGYQYLDGEDALKVVRFRSYPGADIERIATQQSFLKAVAKQLLKLGNLTKIDNIYDIFIEYVETDLALSNIAWYGLRLSELKEENINFYTLPEFYNDSMKGLSYCTILIDEWLLMLNESFNPYREDIEEDELNILTRDENGNLYATSGEIAGGISSFYDNTGGSSDVQPTPDKTPPPVETQPPVETMEPTPSTEQPSPETSAPPVETPPEETEATNTPTPTEAIAPVETDIPEPEAEDMHPETIIGD